jgi:protein-disulfide isomerase
MKAPPNDRAFDKILNNLNLNTELVQNAMKSNEVDGMIAYTRALAEQLKISGTPTFIMNDELIRGYVPFDTLISIVANKRD